MVHWVFTSSYQSQSQIHKSSMVCSCYDVIYVLNSGAEHWTKKTKGKKSDAVLTGTLTLLVVQMLFIQATPCCRMSKHSPL